LRLLPLILSDRLSHGARRVNDASINIAILGLLHTKVNRHIFLDGHLASSAEHSHCSTLNGVMAAGTHCQSISLEVVSKFVIQPGSVPPRGCVLGTAGPIADEHNVKVAHGAEKE